MGKISSGEDEQKHNNKATDRQVSLQPHLLSKKH